MLPALTAKEPLSKGVRHKLIANKGINQANFFHQIQILEPAVLTQCTKVRPKKLCADENCELIAK